MIDFQSHMQSISFKEAKNGLNYKCTLFFQNKPIGEAEVVKDSGIERSAKRFFPEIIKKEDKVVRFQGIHIAEEFRGQKFGKLLMLHVFQQYPDVWLANSQLGFDGEEDSAVKTIESIGVELHWASNKGGFFIAKYKKREEKENYSLSLAIDKSLDENSYKPFFDAVIKKLRVFCQYLTVATQRFYRLHSREDLTKKDFPEVVRNARFTNLFIPLSDNADSNRGMIFLIDQLNHNMENICIFLGELLNKNKQFVDYYKERNPILFVYSNIEAILNLKTDILDEHPDEHPEIKKNIKSIIDFIKKLEPKIRLIHKEFANKINSLYV